MSWCTLSVQKTLSTQFAIDVSLALSHRRVGIAGPSGSGKSTLIGLMTGLIRPDAGQVQLLGRTLVDTRTGCWVAPWHRNLGWVLQDAMLFPHLSVRENCLFGAPASGNLVFNQVVALLELRGLLDRRPRHLSGGERQRVALARAVLSEPAVLLCDEPFAALDRPRRQRLAGVLLDLVTALSLPLVLVSHDPHDLHQLTTQVVHLEYGRLARISRPR